MHLKNLRNRKEKLPVVEIIINNDGMRIRKALKYSGCSKNTYYGNKDHSNDITTATAVTAAATAVTTTIEKEIQQISMERQTYGNKRMAAMLTKILGRPINRKRVQRIFRKMDGFHYTITTEERNPLFKNTKCKSI
jgi:transposase